MLYCLTRECSAYTSEPLQLGVFTTAEKAAAAKEQYISYYQTHSDPLAKQCYHEVDLTTDVEVVEFATDATFGQLAFLVLGSCEGMGQIFQGIDLIEPSFHAAYEQGRQLYQRLHVNCSVVEGKHRCQGYVDELLLDIVLVDQLRFQNQSTYFDVNGKQTEEELQQELLSAFEEKMSAALTTALHISTDEWRKEIADWNQDLADCDCTKECSCASYCKPTEPPIDWPGHEAVSAAEQWIRTRVATYPPNLYQPQLVQRLETDPEGVPPAVSYLLHQL